MLIVLNGISTMYEGGLEGECAVGVYAGGGCWGFVDAVGVYGGSSVVVDIAGLVRDFSMEMRKGLDEQV